MPTREENPSQQGEKGKPACVCAEAGREARPQAGSARPGTAPEAVWHGGSGQGFGSCSSWL